VLRLMEWRFHLGCLTLLDCGAPLPLYSFNWSAPPRAPVLFPTNFSQASYPFDPGWNGAAPVAVGSYVPPPVFTSFPDDQPPGID
jgi:hypothetical protein